MVVGEPVGTTRDSLANERLAELVVLVPLAVTVAVTVMNTVEAVGHACSKVSLVDIYRKRECRNVPVDGDWVPVRLPSEIEREKDPVPVGPAVGVVMDEFQGPMVQDVVFEPVPVGIYGVLELPEGYFGVDEGGGDWLPVRLPTGMLIVPVPVGLYVVVLPLG